jgi:hypothetical protein
MSAIEDAEALSVILPNTPTDATSVNKALNRVFRVRYKRASLCQAESRANGLSAQPGSESTSPLNLWMYPGAARWELERPDMVLPAAEGA